MPDSTLILPTGCLKNGDCNTMNVNELDKISWKYENKFWAIFEPHYI